MRLNSSSTTLYSAANGWWKKICITGLVKEKLVRRIIFVNAFFPKEPFSFECIKADTCWALTREKVGWKIMGICH